MIVYPDITLRQGRCVTLRHGQTPIPVVHEGDPVAIARRFARDGAEWLNVVDLDAGGRHTRDNTAVVREILRAVDIPVQVGGGIARPFHVDWWIDNGADCVVIGSAAVLDPSLVVEACERHPYRVLLAIEVTQGLLRVDGWTRPSEHAARSFLAHFDRLPLAGVVVTDVDYDRALPDASFALVSALGHELSMPVIASGLVKTLDDLATLRYLDVISGAVVGRALHQGAFTLRQAMAVAADADRPRGEERRPASVA